MLERGRPTYFCHHCAKQVEIEAKPGRRDECPHCGSELHVCLNCSLYDPKLSRGCREPQADEVRELARANFCSWFTFREGAPEKSQQSESEKAKNAFDALFKK